MIKQWLGERVEQEMDKSLKSGNFS
jgi:hypothetical protein